MTELGTRYDVDGLVLECTDAVAAGIGFYEFTIVSRGPYEGRKIWLAEPTDGTFEYRAQIVHSDGFGFMCGHDEDDPDCTPCGGDLIFELDGLLFNAEDGPEYQED